MNIPCACFAVPLRALLVPNSGFALPRAVVDLQRRRNNIERGFDAERPVYDSVKLTVRKLPFVFGGWPGEPR